MTSARPGVQLAVSAEPSAVFAFFQQTAAIAEIELKKLIRDPTEVLARAVQPVLWIVVFGNVFSRIRAIPTGNVSYLAFMTPGILAQSVLFVAIFYGIAVIWERDLGIVHKLLVSPAQRAALVYGKATSAGFRGAVQATIIYPIAIMPHWLRVVAYLNPLTYLVDALRTLMIGPSQSSHGVLTNFGIIGLIFVILAAIATKLYPSLVR